MDYPNLMVEPPSSCIVMHCEAPGSGIDDDNAEGGGMDGTASGTTTGGGRTAVMLEDDSGSGLIFPKR